MKKEKQDQLQMSDASGDLGVMIGKWQSFINMQLNCEQLTFIKRDPL